MRRLSMLAMVAAFVASSCAGGETASSTTTATPVTQPASSAGAPEASIAPDPAAPAGTAPETTVASTTPVEAAPATTVETTVVPTETSPATTAPLDAAPTATTSTATAAAPVTEDDLTLFIAAAERSLAGTSQESAVFDDPEIYIGLGQASCDRFSGGDEFEQIAVDLLSDLDTDESEDETKLVGAILGAATRTLCPEHADKL